MVDVAAAAQAASALPAVVGAAGGGLGVVWLARVLFKRMIDQYDKRHDEQAKKLDLVAGKFEGALDTLKEKLGDVKIKIALLEQGLTTTQAIRSEFLALQASLEAKLAEARRQVESLADDVGVAHRRVELLATGDNEISKVTKPNRRRT